MSAASEKLRLPDLLDFYTRLILFCRKNLAEATIQAKMCPEQTTAQYSVSFFQAKLKHIRYEHTFLIV